MGAVYPPVAGILSGQLASCLQALQAGARWSPFSISGREAETLLTTKLVFSDHDINCLQPRITQSATITRLHKLNPEAFRDQMQGFPREAHCAGAGEMQGFLREAQCAECVQEEKLSILYI